MGLDTTHNCWHGAYSSFSQWRNALAVAAGYKLEKVSYWEGHETEVPAIQRPDGAGHLTGDWDDIPEDPVMIILAHSDCDGRIKAEHCSALADALEKLLPKMSDEGFHCTDRDRTQQFIDGLRVAAEAKEDVEFH